MKTSLTSRSTSDASCSRLYRTFQLRDKVRRYASQLPKLKNFHLVQPSADVNYLNFVYQYEISEVMQTVNLSMIDLSALKNLDQKLIVPHTEPQKKYTHIPLITSAITGFLLGCMFNILHADKINIWTNTTWWGLSMGYCFAAICALSSSKVRTLKAYPMLGWTGFQIFKMNFSLKHTPLRRELFTRANLFQRFHWISLGIVTIDLSINFISWMMRRMMHYQMFALTQKLNLIEVTAQNGDLVSARNHFLNFSKKFKKWLNPFFCDNTSLNWKYYYLDGVTSVQGVSAENAYVIALEFSQTSEQKILVLQALINLYHNRLNNNGDQKYHKEKIQNLIQKIPKESQVYQEMEADLAKALNQCQILLKQENYEEALKQFNHVSFTGFSRYAFQSISIVYYQLKAIFTLYGAISKEQDSLDIESRFKIAQHDFLIAQECLEKNYPNHLDSNAENLTALNKILNLHATQDTTACPAIRMEI